MQAYLVNCNPSKVEKSVSGKDSAIFQCNRNFCRGSLIMAYKYSHPYAWLQSKIEKMATNGDIEGLKAIALQLGMFLDADTIQDEFQSDMDQDGYFDEVAE